MPIPHGLTMTSKRYASSSIAYSLRLYESTQGIIALGALCVECYYFLFFILLSGDDVVMRGSWAFHSQGLHRQP